MRKIVQAYAVVEILDGTAFEEKFLNAFQNLKLYTKFAILLIKIYI